MSHRLGRAVGVVDALEHVLVKSVEAIAGAILIIMVAIVFAAVADRFLLGLGLSWPEELARYMLIWVSMLSAALAVPKGYHYVVDYFYKALLPDVGQRVLRIVGLALSLITVLVLLSSSVELTSRVSWQLAPALAVSMSWAYAALPVSFGLMALFFLGEIIRSLGNFNESQAPAVPAEEPRKC